VLYFFFQVPSTSSVILKFELIYTPLLGNTYVRKDPIIRVGNIPLGLDPYRTKLPYNFVMDRMQCSKTEEVYGCVVGHTGQALFELAFICFNKFIKHRHLKVQNLLIKRKT
jgi:hypothetical protein